MGAVRLGQENQLPFDHILRAMAFAFFFQACDEKGYHTKADLLFDNHLGKGVPFVLKEVCGIHPGEDGIITGFYDLLDTLKRARI
jgi:hypothetical protein